MTKKINDTLAFKQVALLILIFVGQTNCFSLHQPTIFLKQKLDSKIDINPYFLDIFEKQQQNKEYVCSYQEGPYCSLLSNATHDIIEDNFYSKNMRNYLKQQMYEVHKQIESHQIKQKDFLPSQYYLDKTRALLDEELLYKPAEKNHPYKLIADFNILESIGSKQDQQLKIIYTINLKSGVQMVSASKPSNSEFLYLQFTDFYFFYPKKQSVNTQPQYLDRLDQLISVPSDSYILTNEQFGKIEFNLKVKIISFYAKINPAYTKYDKLKAYIKCYDLIKQKEFQFDMNEIQNQFKLFKIESNHKINAITFSPYVIIDNIVFQIERSDVIDTNQYPAIDTNNNSREIKDIIESFDKEAYIYTNWKTSSKELSNGNQPRKGVRITKEERKKKQKETIQKIKEQIPNQIQEKLYKEVEFKKLFDEEKIVQDLQKILNKLSDQNIIQQENIQDIKQKQKINLDKPNNNADQNKKEEDSINNKKDNIKTQNDLNKTKYEKVKKNQKTKNENSNKMKEDKKVFDEDSIEQMVNDLLNDKGLKKQVQQEISKIYETMRKLSPSILGKLTDEQIEKKIEDGGYQSLLLLAIDEYLNETEENAKEAIKQSQQAKSSPSAQQIQDNLSQKNYQKENSKIQNNLSQKNEEKDQTEGKKVQDSLSQKNEEKYQTEGKKVQDSLSQKNEKKDFKENNEVKQDKKQENVKAA
ncbi:hypothetical protein ABPG74_018076 [Tetrahymena malaccensis]